MIRVGVVGAGGRMGQEVCRAVTEAADTELVAEVDIDDPLDRLVEQGVEVIVDFTVLDAARGNLLYASEHGIHAVVGTTGFSEADLESFRTSFTTSNLLIS